MHGNSPLFNYRDGVWNNGEGFAASGPDADSGGWRGLDDGTGLTLADVREYPYPPGSQYSQGWHNNFTLVEPLTNNGPQTMRRWVGYLRPAGLPDLHGSDHPDPAVRNVPANQNVVWAADAAFELFAPNVPRAGRPVILIVGILATFGMPDGGVQLLLSYPGIGSPDGLMRERGLGAQWYQNIGDVKQRAVAPEFLAIYQAHQPNSELFYPVVLAGVPPVIGRQTELVHQRVMQMARAARLMLGSAAHVPPDFGDPVNPDSVKVVLAGGSNGGHQALWALLDQQDKVHGASVGAINPSIQRLYSEQEVAYTLGHLSGANISGAQLSAYEGRNWQHFVWQRNRKIRDFSLMGQTLLGRMTRPVCCFAGDEDVTSTGTDWARLLAGGGYPASGSALTAGANHLAFAIADKRCHGGGRVNSPYGNPHFGYSDILHEKELAFDVCAQVHASSAAATPVPAMPATGSFDRDFDDPSEWAFARQWAPPPGGGALVEDAAFFQAAQPGFAGTRLGHQESMIIRAGKIYVGGTEGVVTEFEVDPTDPVRQPLRASRRARPLGPSGLMQQGDPLGHAAFGLVKTSSGFVVGTRRHLVRLNANMEEVGRAALTWEQAKPYRLRVGEIFSQWPGNEIVCVSDHGGLLVFQDDLSQSFEYREPGIRDVVLTGASYPAAGTTSKSALSLLSERFVVANITLHTPGTAPPSGYMAELHAASAPFNEQPVDLEVQDIGGAKLLILLSTVPVGSQPYVLRCYNPSTLSVLWERQYPSFSGPAPLSGAVDLATISVDNPPGGNNDEVVGEHIVLLMGDALQFHDDNGNQLARRDLGGPNGYPMARQASAIAVGELATGGPAGPYEQEIAISTQTGHVVWFHANELAATGPLPATLQVGQAVQPRTNQALSCTWCMARRGSNSFLHVLDQSGMLWQVSDTGAISFVASNELATNAVGWADVPAPAGPILPGSFYWLPEQGLPGTGAMWFTTKQPEDGSIVIYEPNVVPSGPGSMNWKAQPLFFRYFENFVLFGRGGAARARANGGYEVHAWADSGWGEHLLGHVVDPAPLLNPPFQVSAAWSSTGLEPSLGGPWATNPGYLHIRNVNPGFAYTSYSAIRPFELGGVSYLAVGCPGGRVRIVRPGTSNPASPMGTIVRESEDFGHGGGALAVRVSGNTVDIFFGVLTHHTPRGGYPTALSDSELLTGAIYWLRWDGTSSTNPLPVVTLLELPPVADRGGFGVCGLALADVLDTGTVADELIATTLAGDFAVFDVSGSILGPLYRSWASGGIGLYNAIHVANLGATGTPAVYCGGSLGVRKWRRP